MNRACIALLAVSLFARCASSESHLGKTKTMLAECSVDAPCADGLSCLCFCTVTCEASDPCIEELERLGIEVDPTRVDCRAPSCEAQGDGQSTDVTGICDVSCSSDADCAVFSDAHRCIGGYCRQELSAEPADGAEVPCPEDMAFAAGDDSSAPADFCLDRYEVTAFAYQACVDDGACEHPAQGNLLTEDRNDNPVNWVSDTQAASYCDWLGRRLPTRSEWQWAANNGATTAYPWGDEEPLASDSPQRVCAFDATSTCPIGAHPSGDSELDVSDLAGNAAEIVDDEAAGAPCVAGGGYTAKASTELAATSCTPYDAPADHIGFRCALTP